MTKYKFGLIFILAIGVLLFMAACSNSDDQQTKFDPSKIKVVTADGKEGKLIPKEELSEKVELEISKRLDDLASSLTSHVEKINNTTYKYIVKNVSDEPKTLQFSSSQRYDFDIITSEGEIIYRYSDGKSFLQVMKDVTLDPGDELSFDIQLPELESGRYKLSIRLTASGYITPTLTEIIIE